MTTPIATPPATPPAPDRQPRRRRRWLRWVLIAVTALVVLLVAVVVAAVKLQPTTPPLSLPASVAAPAGPLDGTWQITTGSVAGFRIDETVLGMTHAVVGRTDDVTGTVTITGDQLTAASLRINLLALRSGAGGEPAPQFSVSLDTEHYPEAAVELTQPVSLDAHFASGAATTVTASGELTLHGVTRAVVAPLSARRDAATVQVAGAIPITLADWNIALPKGYGILGSLADHGVAEFLLVLRRT